MDKFEASVWETTNAALIKKIRSGSVTEAQLLAGGAIERGVAADDYPCNNNGNDCASIYAVSIPGVKPSRFITWLQAQQAAANSWKRLLTNAEWQMAAAGTPDPGTDNGTTDCNVSTESPAADTGSRSDCVSRFGVFDMVGNVWEFVADWVPESTVCLTPMLANDFDCLAGASETDGPGVISRGGGVGNNVFAGVFAVQGIRLPWEYASDHGFRCGR